MKQSKLFPGIWFKKQLSVLGISLKLIKQNPHTVVQEIQNLFYQQKVWKESKYCLVMINNVGGL